MSSPAKPSIAFCESQKLSATISVRSPSVRRSNQAPRFPGVRRYPRGRSALRRRRKHRHPVPGPHRARSSRSFSDTPISPWPRPARSHRRWPRLLALPPWAPASPFPPSPGPRLLASPRRPGQPVSTVPGPRLLPRARSARSPVLTVPVSSVAGGLPARSDRDRSRDQVCPAGRWRRGWYPLYRTNRPIRDQAVISR